MEDHKIIPKTHLRRKELLQKMRRHNNAYSPIRTVKLLLFWLPLRHLNTGDNFCHISLPKPDRPKSRPYLPARMSGSGLRHDQIK
jgi:hypothetical protein